MVAKAAWLTIEPQISLSKYLASEDPSFFPMTAPFWPPEDKEASEDDFELRYIEDDSTEKH